MNESRLPPELRLALDAIARSTDELLTALRKSDAVEMERAIQKRADAVECLEAPLREFIANDSSESSKLLAEEKAKLDRSAQNVIDELQLTVGRIRESLRTPDRNAVRSYSKQREGQATAVGLDRSG